jgi:hypothetical protein
LDPTQSAKSQSSSDERKIDTLVDDIYNILQNGRPDLAETDFARFGEVFSGVLASRLRGPRDSAGRPTLRMSNLGRPDRQLWYQLADPSSESEQFSGHTLLKFLYGDLIEALMLSLAELAGHKVELQQTEVEIDGVVGHNDAVIDGVVVDVKSASSHSFRKFRDGSLREDDPFGYMEQLAGYSAGLGGLDGAFLAVDKTLGHVTLMSVGADELAKLDTRARVAHIRDVLANPEPPPRCYEPVEHGKSGNLALGVGCSYCPFKFKCWSDANDGLGLRSFLYSGGPVHFTNVAKEPQVLEITF